MTPDHRYGHPDRRREAAARWCEDFSE